MDSELKKQAETLFNDLGLNLSSAINIFIRQAIREQAIPFEITCKNKIQFANNKQYEEAVKKDIEDNHYVYETLAKK